VWQHLRHPPSEATNANDRSSGESSIAAALIDFDKVVSREVNDLSGLINMSDA
jgi:hypothetical protein